jgi:hypothetical protein
MAWFAPNGDFYLGDGYGSNRMLRFSLQGKFLGEIAKPGREDGEFDNPHGQWVDPRSEKPLLVVADRGNHRIQTFTLDGVHIRTIKDEARLRRPCNFQTLGEWMVRPDLDVCILDREFSGCATRRRKGRDRRSRITAQPVSRSIHSRKIQHTPRCYLSQQWGHSRSGMVTDRANHAPAQGLTEFVCHFDFERGY